MYYFNLNQFVSVKNKIITLERTVEIRSYNMYIIYKFLTGYVYEEK